ncbi:hypothetical protein Tco_0996326 [Tanacetum coccineum]
MSLRVLSNVSKHRRSFISASSQIMRSSGSLNLEYDVCLDGSNNEGMPEDGTTRTILPSYHRVVITVFQRKVFLVPPWPYTNTNPCQLSMEVLRIRSYTKTWKPCQGDSLNLPDHRPDAFCKRDHDDHSDDPPGGRRV